VRRDRENAFMTNPPIFLALVAPALHFPPDARLRFP